VVLISVQNRSMIGYGRGPPTASRPRSTPTAHSRASGRNSGDRRPPHPLSGSHYRIPSLPSVDLRGRPRPSLAMVSSLPSPSSRPHPSLNRRRRRIRVVTESCNLGHLAEDCMVERSVVYLVTGFIFIDRSAEIPCTVITKFRNVDIQGSIFCDV
jgi:hypothetical protein